MFSAATFTENCLYVASNSQASVASTIYVVSVLAQVTRMTTANSPCTKLGPNDLSHHNAKLLTSNNKHLIINILHKLQTLFLQILTNN